MKQDTCRHSSGELRRVHPADVLGLVEGGEERDPQEWRRSLQNVISLGKVGAVVGRGAVQRTCELLQELILIDSQEGEGVEDVPTKVIGQILHHVLATIRPETTTAWLSLMGTWSFSKTLWNDHGRRSRGSRSTHREHVIKFMRRQADFDALRVAAGVVFTVAGVIKESPEFRNESLLLGEIAGEIHDIGRRLCGADRR